jgi:hypothetical protein
MQIIQLTGQFRSGLLGMPVPQSRNLEEERRLVRWLNDEWDDDSSARFEKWKLEEGPLPDLPSDEDAPARRTILKEFLPRLIKVQSLPSSAREALKRGREAMKKSPGKYADEEEAANEEGGFNDRARLVKMLRKHTILPTIPSPGDPVKLLVRGDNMTEVWAMYVLLQMASDGVLEKLLQCGCGCGKWFIRKRQIDRFALDACRVRFHQASEIARKLRAKRARETYRLERQGIVSAGYGKSRGGRPRKHV